MYCNFDGPSFSAPPLRSLIIANGAYAIFVLYLNKCVYRLHLRSFSYIVLTSSTISSGGGENQRIMVHEKSLFLTLIPLFKNGLRAPDAMTASQTIGYGSGVSHGVPVYLPAGIPNHTAWWQRQMCGNNLPQCRTRLCCD